MNWLNRVREMSVPLVALFCLVILMSVGLTISITTERAVKQELAREAGAQGDLLASAVAGALAFDDRTAAKDYVDAVQVNRNVVGAAVYDTDNRLVASFVRPGEQLDPVARPDNRSTVFQDGRLYVVRPVVQGGQHLGVIQLKLLEAPASQRFSRYAGMMIVLGLAALLITVITLTQGALRRANRALSARANDLALVNARLQEQMEEREKAEEALRQSQKMEAIGRLTGGVAHDFNNLLMILSSATELMQRTDDPARRATLTEGMRQAIERGASLTRHLLAFSRRTPVKAMVIDVGDQVEGMRILLERSLREDIVLKIDVLRPLKAVEVDVGEFELAVLNLAVNARDAMPDGGHLTLSVWPEIDPEGAEMVCVEVEDTGAGIPPQLLSRVFEPFFTTKEVGRGTGLGLSQVYGFASSSGGGVEVQSAEGRGTRFLLRIATTDKVPGPTTVRPTAGARAQGRRRVLLVEDDDGVAFGVSAMLQDLGYAFRRVGGGEEAILTLEEDPAFDLVLSDMVMPGRVGGLMLATELRARRPELPVILSTGYSDAAATAAAGGFVVLSKPYDLAELGAALADALAHAPVSREA